jgi:cytosine/adenosine deaminase-related metal-dependent hydrolase
MPTYLSASEIYPVSGPVLKNGVLEVDQNGKITALYTREQAEGRNIVPTAVYPGALVPGFINTHCHLELSHMKGKIKEHTGLLDFVGQIIRTREIDDQTALHAMERADHEMFENGIVAVGDISNRGISKVVKLNSKLHYHTFIEALGFDPQKAPEIMRQALALKDEFAPLRAAIAPHAPYSVSDPLLHAIGSLALQEGSPITIHNQETPAENEFFQSKTGSFLTLYEFLKLDLSFYNAAGTTSLQATLPKLPASKTLLVHNTTTSLEDVEFAISHHSLLYWCLCPSTNLYIENLLPNVDMLINAGLRITLGTDSLASNHQLSILKEMQVLQQQKEVAFETLLTWATLNGASFLEIDEQFGSLEPGKTPGILWINDLNNTLITNQTTVTRLF